VANGSSSTVRKPGISIKDSLQRTAEKKEESDQEVIQELSKSESSGHTEIGVDPDAIIKAWNDYAASVKKTKPRIHSTLINNKPVVKTDGRVMVLLNSEAQRDNFVKNIRSELTGFIHSSTGISAVEIITEVAEAEQNGKRIYTEQDKLDYLMKKNPELGQLKTRFNLDFDD